MGPQILSLLASSNAITEGQSIDITAVVSHSAGIERLVGGHLLAADMTASLGSFVQTGGQPGTYELSLSWEAIHAAEPIDFLGETPSRTFYAEFFDADGLTASQSIDIDLTCNLQMACGGKCPVGECMPVYTPCSAGSICLVNADPAIGLRCSASEGGQFLEECTSNNDCAEGFICRGDSLLSACPFNECCTVRCDPLDPNVVGCPGGLTCRQTSSTYVCAEHTGSCLD
jgi:hypothetical protein